MLHTSIPPFIVDVILTVCVHILHITLIIDEVGDRPYEISAGAEAIEHWLSVIPKCETVVALHLSIYTVMLCFVEGNALLLKQLSDALSSLLAPNCRVSYTDDPALSD